MTLTFDLSVRLVMAALGSGEKIDFPSGAGKLASVGLGDFPQNSKDSSPYFALRHTLKYKAARYSSHQSERLSIMSLLSVSAYLDGQCGSVLSFSDETRHQFASQLSFLKSNNESR